MKLLLKLTTVFALSEGFSIGLRMRRRAGRRSGLRAAWALRPAADLPGVWGLRLATLSQKSLFYLVAGFATLMALGTTSVNVRAELSETEPTSSRGTPAEAAMAEPTTSGDNGVGGCEELLRRPQMSTSSAALNATSSAAFNNRAGLPILGTEEPMAPLTPLAAHLDVAFLKTKLPGLPIEGEPRFINRGLEKYEVELIPLDLELVILRLFLPCPGLDANLTYQWRIGHAPKRGLQGREFYIKASELRQKSQEELLTFLSQVRISDFTLDKRTAQSLARVANETINSSRVNPVGSGFETGARELSTMLFKLRCQVHF